MLGALARWYHGVRVKEKPPYVPWSRLSRFIGDGKPPTFDDGNPYNGYINPYYWVDEVIPLYGNNGSLDPSAY